MRAIPGRTTNGSTCHMLLDQTVRPNCAAIIGWHAPISSTPLPVFAGFRSEYDEGATATLCRKECLDKSVITRYEPIARRLVPSEAGRAASAIASRSRTRPPVTATTFQSRPSLERLWRTISPGFRWRALARSSGWLAAQPRDWRGEAQRSICPHHKGRSM
jgi:hypothetical protein